ncbi:MAG: type II toxin-antitoxin system PemK/MazF family toxin [Myxococcota bacterium]
MVAHRGEVWWADFGEPRGSEPGFMRPVVIVQANPLNESTMATVMVVPLTSNLRRAEALGNVRLEIKETGLDKVSVALTCQIVTLDDDWLVERVNVLPIRAMRRLDDGLKLALAL